MLINILISLFLFVLLRFYFILKNRENDFFSLSSLFLVFAIAEIPYLFVLNNDKSLIHDYVIIHIKDYEWVFAKHILLKLLFLVIAYLVMLYSNPTNRKLKNKWNIDSFSLKKMKKIAYFYIFSTIITYLFFLNKVGGFIYLFMHMDSKTLVVQGTGLYRNLFFLFSLLSIGFYIHYLSKLSNIKMNKLITLIIIVIMFFLLLASFGERKNPIILLIFSMAAWNYKIKKIKIITVRNLFLFITLLFFSALGPILRKHGAMDMYVEKPFLIFNDALPYMGEVFKRFSEIDISLFIYSHFDEFNKFWFGSSFGDFFTGFIPSEYYKDKPPLDEGVYIYALAHNNMVSPPTAFHMMRPVGWPLSRVTAGFVHFGTLGVIIHAMIVGYILKFLFNILKGSNFSPYALVMYITLMTTNFGISNSYIFNNLILLIAIIILSNFHKTSIK